MIVARTAAAFVSTVSLLSLCTLLRFKERSVRPAPIVFCYIFHLKVRLEDGKLVWPVLFLYPEKGETDFCNGFFTPSAPPLSHRPQSEVSQPLPRSPTQALLPVDPALGRLVDPSNGNTFTSYWFNVEDRSSFPLLLRYKIIFLVHDIACASCKM